MKAIRINRFGGPEVLEIADLPAPRPAADELLVAVEAAALNHLDIWVRRGLPGSTPPLVMGSDGAGRIAALGGDVQGFAVGDRVVIQPGTFCGGCKYCRSGRENLCQQYGILGESENGVQAQLVALRQHNVFPLAEHLTYEEGASFGLVFLTAFQMLVKRAQLQQGETVLVVGGSSGVGAAAIQIAAHMGARVIATASPGKKTEFAKTMGAEAVVDHYSTDWYRQVLDFTGAKKVDVVFEHVGAATWEQALRTLAVGGRLVFCGGTSGPQVEINLRHAFRKHLSFLGSTMGDLDTFRSVVNLFNQKAYRPFVDSVFTMDQIGDAHRYLEDSDHCGKVVIRIDQN